MPDETPQQIAKRKGKPYLRLTIDTRYSAPNGTLVEIEGPFEDAHVQAAYELLQKLMER